MYKWNVNISDWVRPEKRILLLIAFLTLFTTQSFAQISSFPYEEGFESGWGSWTNPGGDDFNWTRTNANTPSNGTGPETRVEGSYYVFTEASNPNFPSKTTYLQATFDFTNVNEPQLGFYIHMYGASMGSLYLDVNDGSWNNGTWSVTGQQQTAGTDEWIFVQVDLSAYGNLSSVIVRFRGVTGSNYDSDIALDDITCWDLCSTLNPGDASISDASLCASGDVDLDLNGYTGGATIQWEESTDNINFSTVSGATSDHETISSLATGSSYFYRALVTDGCSQYSDTVSVTVTNGASNSLPYSESFESGIGDWTNSASDDMDWTRTNTTTPSNNTGPDAAADGSWYLFTEASNPNNPDKVALFQQTFDFSGNTHPEMTFYYHMYGANIGSLHLDANADQDVWSVSGQQQASGADPWGEASIDLSAYAGLSCVAITLRGITGSGFASDISIDNINLCERIVGGTASISTGSLCGGGSVDVSVSGYTPGATIQWQQSTDNINFSDVIGKTSDNETMTGLSTGNNYYYRAQITYGCTGYSDTVAVSVAAAGGNAPPYTEDFETGVGDWIDATGDDMDWTRDNAGTPSTGTGPSTGANSSTWYMFTEASNPNNPDKTAILEQVFDFSATTHPELKFYYHMYGTNIGTLNVDVNADQAVWSITGQQQTSETDPWVLATVDLEDYAGESCVTVRFRGITGNGFASDIAIDEVNLCDRVETGDASLSVNVICGTGTASLSLTGYDGSATLQWQESTDNINFSDISGATSDSHDVVDPAAGSTYYYRAAVTKSCTYYSDTVSLVVTSAGGNAPPYAESFESGLGDWTNASGDDMDWTRDDAGTPSTGTGPDAAIDGTWYVYTEASTPNFPTKVAIFEQTFDLSAATHPELHFAYHMYGANMGTLNVDVNTDMAVWTKTGQQSADGTDWQYANVDLSDYAGLPCVSIQFRGITGSNFDSDMTIDDISLCDKPQTAPIEGRDSVCANESGITYSVPAPTSSTYTWIITGGTASPAPGPNDTVITVNWGSTAMADAQVQVVEDNGCQGDTVSLDVAIHTLPMDTVTGDINVLEYESGVNYSLTARNGYTYNWIISGGTLTSGQGTDAVTVDWGAATSGNVQVTPGSGCGAGTAYDLPVTVYGNIKSITTGDWNQTSTWDCGTCTPGPTDNVIIDSGDVVTLVGNTTVGNLIIHATGTLDIGSYVLTVNGDLTVNGELYGDGTTSPYIILGGTDTEFGGIGDIFDLNQIRMTTGNKTIPSGANLTVDDAKLRLYDGITVTNNGSIAVDKNIDRITGTPVWLNKANSYLSVGGNLLLTNASFDASAANNTVAYTGSANQTVKAATTGYHHLTLSGSGTKGLEANADINGNVTINAPFATNDFNLDVAGNWTNNSTFSAGTSLTTFSGTTTISGTSSSTFHDVTVSGTLTSQVGDTLGITGNWIITGGFNHNNGLMYFNGSTAQTITGGLTYNDLTIDNASGVTILSGEHNLIGTLHTEAGTFTTGDDFTLISNVSGTASIGEIKSGADVTGDITVQRYITGNAGYRNVSFPVSGATLVQLNDDVTLTGIAGTGNEWEDYWTNMYWYDEDYAGTGDINEGWVAMSDVSDGLSNDKGYTLWMYDRDMPVTLDVTGPAVTGDVNIPLTYDNSGGPTDNGWNLVANPYPSTIDWDAANMNYNASVNNAIYVFRDDIQQYASYVGGVGTNGGSRYIPSCQAFWVQTNGSSPGLSMKESVKVDNDVTFYRVVSEYDNMVEVRIDGLGFQDQTTVRFSQDASANFDSELDAHKLISTTPDVPNLCTIDQANEIYSINTQPELQGETTIPMDVMVEHGAKYTLTFSQLSTLEPEITVTLVDHITGKEQDIRKKSTYEFTGDTTFTDTEFSLIFSRNTAIENLETFKAELEEDVVNLSWITSTETDCDFYTVLRTTDFKHIEEIAQVDGAGNSNKKLKYHEQDPQPLTGISYYRLRQTDFNGNEAYSNYVQVNYDGITTSVQNPGDTDAPQLNVYPNPAVSNLFIRYSNLQQHHVRLTVYNALGQAIDSYALNSFSVKSSGEIRIDLNAHGYQKGIYFIQLDSDEGVLSRQQFVVN
ncbi:MAG: T9SS type A sorting domain-containing protein [Flavobacteriales bacterium]|nr:T9SS type A sorting domain-containing protein [Flavobacteriales bacterium]MCB9449068.1 T9SS type A sorting domain-containing protein [Flavobacteriales bacterium]